MSANQIIACESIILENLKTSFEGFRDDNKVRDTMTRKEEIAAEARAELMPIIAEKDEQLAELSEQNTEKDEQLAEKDVLIAELKAQIAEKTN